MKGKETRDERLKRTKNQKPNTMEEKYVQEKS